MGANDKHKNSVFSLLFSDPNVLRELYSAIEGVELPPDTPIDVNTLSNALFMGQINDVSFTVGGRLIVLLEHQSTVNQNMPLRLLMYAARLYEKIIDRMKLYQTSLEKIPEPVFIVLYNGKAPYPERATLKLSDAFKDAADLRAKNPGGPALELTVQVYNINQGHNAAMLEKCEALGGYSAFVSKVWECRQTMALEDAMKAAIKHCIDNGILRPFLETHSSEVQNMLITEWNLEEAQQAWLAQGRDEGIEIGVGKGRNEGIEIGLGRGRNEGIEIGLGRGRSEGRSEGEGNIVALLESGKSPEEIIREFRTKTATAGADASASQARPQA